MSTEAEIIGRYAREALAPAELADGQRYMFRAADGSLEEVDLTGATPAFKTGVVRVTDVASFVCCWKKHSDESSEIFADIDTGTVTAVLDAHTATEARHQRHLVILTLAATPEWKTWTRAAGRYHRQEEFAEFLEDNCMDLAPAGEPIVMPGGTYPNIDAASFLELAEHLTAHSNARFVKGKKLHNGQVTFAYTEDVTVRGGQKGDIDVPTVFLLAIRPYEDCAAGRLVARLRTRTGVETGMQIGFWLMDADKVKRAAFAEVLDRVFEETGAAIPILLGRPAA